MQAIYGKDNIHSVHVVHNEEALAPLVAQYDKVKGDLEDLVDHYMSLFKRAKSEEPKQVGGWVWGCRAAAWCSAAPLLGCGVVRCGAVRCRRRAAGAAAKGAPGTVQQGQGKRRR
jgi:hypothetical protein